MLSVNFLTAIYTEALMVHLNFVVGCYELTLNLLKAYEDTGAEET